MYDDISDNDDFLRINDTVRQSHDDHLATFMSVHASQMLSVIYHCIRYSNDKDDGDENDYSSNDDACLPDVKFHTTGANDNHNNVQMMMIMMINDNNNFGNDDACLPDVISYMSLYQKY